MTNTPVVSGSENINPMSEAPRQFALDISKTPEPGLGNFITPNPSGSAISIADLLTHLLKAMFGLALEHNISAIYLTPNDSNGWVTLEKNIENLPNALLIDDVDALNTMQQALLFRIQIETKEKSGKLLFITGSQSIAGLDLRDDVKSRLGWGLNFELTVLSDAQKIIAINQADLERGINLSQDVAPWLLSNFHRDLPSLLSLIEALDHFSLERKRAVTLPLLREFLQSNN